CVVALDATDGTVQWCDDTVNTEQSVVAGPDQLYLRDGGTLVAFDPQRRGVIWRCEFGSGRTLSTPVTDGERLFVHVQGSEERLVAVRGGAPLWSVPASSAPVVANGRLFVLHYATLRAVDPETGEEIWQQSLGSADFDTLSVREGQLYVTGSGLTAVDTESGDSNWSRNVPPGRTVRAAVAPERVYVPTRRLAAAPPRLYTYRRETAERISCRRPASFVSGPVVTTDELLIFVGGFDPEAEASTVFVQAQRHTGGTEWRVTRQPQSTGLSLCAGREALFFRHGSTVEGFVFE
ncbi:MAG: hypothetical protein J07HB67_02511, partial [halophilic archaeon J07HB67]